MNRNKIAYIIITVILFAGLCYIGVNYWNNIICSVRGGNYEAYFSYVKTSYPSDGAIKYRCFMPIDNYVY